MMHRTFLVASIASGLLAATLTGAGCSDDSEPTSGPGGGDGGSGGGAGGANVGPDRHVVVLFTSDEHSHLFAFTPELDDYPLATKPGPGTLVGGVARRAAVIKQERAAAKTAKKDSILVSAGDNQMGCVTHAAFETDSIDYGTMKALGYDATTFGNHEFDFGPQALANSISAGKAGDGLPPIVASNIHFSNSDPGDDDLAAHFSEKPDDDKPVNRYRVITTDSGVKVGIVGIIGANAEFVAPNKGPVQFSARGSEDEGDRAKILPKVYADIQPIVDTLRNDEKVDLVVALSHSGVEDSLTPAGREAGEDTQICKNVSGIDLIVSGHSHNPDKNPIEVTNTKSKKDCLVLNASSFGAHLGRVDFTIPGDKTKDVTWDRGSQTLIEVNDKTVPDPEHAAGIDDLLEKVENSGTAPLGSFLENLVSRATGQTIQNNGSTPGDLYFFNIGNTAFDVTDTHSLIYLSADAMLAAADEWAAAPGPNQGKVTNLALDSAGDIRSVLRVGKTGAISAADAFNVVPLGLSPNPADGTVGYPLVRANFGGLYLRATVEFALTNGPVSNDFDLGFAGVKVEFDRTRPPVVATADVFDPAKGQVIRLSIDTDHSDGFEQYDQLVYDRDNGGDQPGAPLTYSVVTSSYIAQFAGSAGVSLFDDNGEGVDDVADIVITRPDGSEIKQAETFLRRIYLSPGQTLPAIYNVNAPEKTQRWICLAGCPN
jgi:5'-nucleotidase / UDP-sugar diphosphatase